MKKLFFAAFLLKSHAATAETVQVEYHGPVALDAFACTDVNENSDVSRICYDKAKRYMVIRLKTTYYHYCAIDAATVQGAAEREVQAGFLRITHTRWRQRRPFRLPHPSHPSKVP